MLSSSLLTPYLLKLTLLMQAANCVHFCLNPFCREVHEVHEGCLTHDNNDSGKSIHNCSSHQLGKLLLKRGLYVTL